jgi:hypothetical protein
MNGGLKMINGKVARILNEYQLVLNVGYADGVKKGMLFVIYEPGDEITDPESGESLGSLELVKGEVAVSHVQETISIAQSKEIENKSTSTVLSARLAEITPSAKSHFEKNFEKLDVRRSDISGTSTAGPITVGDLARSVED